MAVDSNAIWLRRKWDSLRLVTGQENPGGMNWEEFGQLYRDNRILFDLFVLGLLKPGDRV